MVDVNLYYFCQMSRVSGLRSPPSSQMGQRRHLMTRLDPWAVYGPLFLIHSPIRRLEPRMSFPESRTFVPHIQCSRLRISAAEPASTTSGQRSRKSSTEKRKLLSLWDMMNFCRDVAALSGAIGAQLLSTSLSQYTTYKTTSMAVGTQLLQLGVVMAITLTFLCGLLMLSKDRQLEQEVDWPEKLLYWTILINTILIVTSIVSGIVLVIAPTVGLQGVTVVTVSLALFIVPIMPVLFRRFHSSSIGQ